VRAVAAALLAATCWVVTAGCGADGAPDPDLHGTLQRSTLFATHRSLRLTVRSDGDDDVRIGAIQLGSPLFEVVPPQHRDAVVPAGGRVVMPLRFGAARCDATGEGPAELITDVDGEDVRVALDESPAEVLATLQAAECASEAVLADVELRLGDRWVRTAPRSATGHLELVQRRPGVTAAVEQLSGNVIFNVGTNDPGAPWVEVSDDRPSASVEIVVDSSRCDPHALIEYKRTFILPALVRVGDAEPVRVDVEASGEAHRALEDLLAACLD